MSITQSDARGDRSQKGKCPVMAMWQISGRGGTSSQAGGLNVYALSPCPPLLPLNTQQYFLSKSSCFQHDGENPRTSRKEPLSPKSPFPLKATKSCTPLAFMGLNKTKGAEQGKVKLLPPWRGPLSRLSPVLTAAVFIGKGEMWLKEETTRRCTECQAARMPVSSWVHQHSEDSHSGGGGSFDTLITPQMQTAPYWPSDRRKYKNLPVIDMGRYHQ